MSTVSMFLRVAHADRSRTLFVLVLPLLVAASQLLNSVVTGLPFTASIPFAAAVVVVTGVTAQYHVARYRREELERWMLPP